MADLGLAPRFEEPDLNSRTAAAGEDCLPDDCVEEDAGELDRVFAAEFGGLDEVDDSYDTVQGIDLKPGTPPEVVTLLEEFIHSSKEVIQRALDLADCQMMRRTSAPTSELRHRKWAKALLPENLETTKRWLRKKGKRALTVYHLEQVSHHAPLRSMPGYLIRFKPENGVFIVDDFRSGRDSIGWPSYMEQTPPMVVRWVYETWVTGRPVEARFEDVDMDTPLGPQVWDISSGSGTVTDLLEYLLGGTVIATDLSAAYGAVVQQDARSIGQYSGHRAQRTAWGPKLDRSVDHPDLVFFDPPSRGTPTHAEVYDEQKGRFTGGGIKQDLARLDRPAWVKTVSAITLKAIKRLAPGGYVSLIVRAGTRSKGKVSPEPEVLDEVKEAISNGARLVQEHPIEFRGRRKQHSLGMNRVPATHLLLARPA